MLYERYPKLNICRNEIEKALGTMVETYRNGGKVLVCGNGGSAADSEHIVGELMKGFLLLSAFANDVDPKMMYAQLVYGYAGKNDLVIGLSTSGNSENVVNALEVAKAVGIKTLALTGQKESRCSQIADVTIRVPAIETYEVQELHLPVYHYLCAQVEKAIFDDERL